MGKLVCPDCRLEFDTEGYRFCSACRTPLVKMDTSTGTNLDEDTTPGSEDPSDQAQFETADEIDKRELDLKVDFERLPLVAGEHGCVPFRFTNTGSRVIRKICFSGHCRAFKDCERSVNFETNLNLSPSRCSENRDFDFDLGSKSGDYALTFNGSYQDDEELWYAFRGSFSLAVRKPGEKASLILEDVYGAMAGEINADGFNEIRVRGGYGVDLGNVVSNSGKRSEDWVTTPIEEDPDQTYLLRKKLQSKAHKRPVPATDARYRADTDAALLSLADDRGQRVVRIWTGSGCRIGKSSENDLMTLLLPDTPENREKNERISRRHCRLDLKSGRVILKDEESTNGTFVDGRRIDSPVTLRDGQMIGLANKMLLRYRDFRSVNEAPEVRRAMSHCMSALDCTAALSRISLDDYRDKAPLEAFVLRRRNNFSDRIEYLFLVKSAIMGCSPKYAAVRVNHASVCDQHARLIIHNRQYFIEALQPHFGTWVDDRHLQPYVPVPLGLKSNIRLGDVVMEFIVPDA